MVPSGLTKEFLILKKSCLEIESTRRRKQRIPQNHWSHHYEWCLMPSLWYRTARRSLTFTLSSRVWWTRCKLICLPLKRYWIKKLLKILSWCKVSSPIFRLKLIPSSPLVTIKWREKLKKWSRTGRIKRQLWLWKTLNWIVMKEFMVRTWKSLRFLISLHSSLKIKTINICSSKRSIMNNRFNLMHRFQCKALVINIARFIFKTETSHKKEEWAKLKRCYR